MTRCTADPTPAHYRHPVPNLVTDALDTVLDKLVVPGYSALGPALRKRWWAADPTPFPQPVDVVITGASSGLGRAAAEGLAALGATVHLVGRSTERLQASADVIRRSVPDAQLVLRECDVSDLTEAHRLADELERDLDALHGLVHCAGLIPDKRVLTPQGHELALATHVLGPFTLTTRLRPLLRDGRVVFVASGGMYPVRAVPTDLEFTGGDYSGVTAYARTKRMQVAVSEMLAERFTGPADPVVHAMHPGWADTPGVSSSIPGFAKVTATVLRTPEQGADTIVWLTAAAEPARSTGRFWHDRRTRSPQFLPGAPDDTAARDKLLQLCEHSAVR